MAEETPITVESAKSAFREDAWEESPKEARTGREEVKTRLYTPVSPLDV